MARQIRPSKVLALNHATGLADNVLAAIRELRKLGKWLTYGVMAVSYFHQSGFLYNLFDPTFKLNLLVILEASSLVIGAFLIPGLFDLAILYMIKLMGTVGLNPDAQKWAKRFLPAPVAMSVVVNVLASLGVGIPAALRPWIIAGIFTMVVSLIGVVEFLHSKATPDYKVIEEIEDRAFATAEDDEVAVEVVAPAPAPIKVMDPMEELVLMGIDRAKAMVGYDAMDKGKKQSFSRRFTTCKARMEKELADPIASVEATTEDSAPVSPADIPATV